MDIKPKTVGVLTILGASIMWALEPVVAKLSYDTADFLETSAIRAVFVMITAAVYIFFTGKKRFVVPRKNIPALIYLAIVGTLFADLLYFYAITRLPVVNAVLLGHMQPLFVVLIAFFVLKEEVLTRHDYGGIALMVMAAVMVTSKTVDNASSFNFGTSDDALVLAATVAWASTAIVMKKYVPKMHAGVITFYRFFFASLAFFVYTLLFSDFVIENIYQVMVGIIVGIGTILYYEGLKRIKTAQVSALELSTPFFAAALGLVILDEAITLLQLFGIALLFFGVYLLSRKEEAYF